MRKTKALIFSLAFTAGITALSFPGYAQLATTDLTQAGTCASLAQSLVGAGITISGVTCTANNPALGTFSGGTGIIGFESGIILSSGRVADVVGPNDSDSTSTGFGTPGDTDLQALVPGFLTFDAAVLEFDFIPSGSQITLQYVFASEEYNEFANAAFNNVFGFFVNGVNRALLPDGETPVSINNVNGGNPFGMNAQNPSFFINNDIGDGGVTPQNAINIQADGLTVVLTLTASVTPNMTNHIKLAIADSGDSVLDSWVFIRAASFTVAFTEPNEAISSEVVSQAGPCNVRRILGDRDRTERIEVVPGTDCTPTGDLTITVDGEPATVRFLSPKAQVTFDGSHIFCWASTTTGRMTCVQTPSGHP